MSKASLTPWNPSARAELKVKHPLPTPETCHCCGGEVVVVRNRVIYGRDYGDWPWAYFCNECHAYVGMHPRTAIPLGTLADPTTRNARKICKPVFEKIFKSGLLSRSKAYKKLAVEMSIDQKDCHFGMFTAEQCYLAADISLMLLAKLRS